MSETLELLGLNGFLIHQEKGIDTRLDSGGGWLPRSVMQKILVARIIIGEPKLILMEDPLPFIEEDEKKKIIDYMMSKERKWTLVVISDYHHWVEKCDRILEL